MPQFRPSLTVSIMAFLGFLLLVTWLLFSLLSFKTAANDLYAQKGQYARTLLAEFVSQLPQTASFSVDDLRSPSSPARLFARKLSEDSSFVRLTLLDADGSVIFSEGRSGTEANLPFAGLPRQAEGNFLRCDGGCVVRIGTIPGAGRPLARVGMVLSLAPENARLSRTKQLLVAYFVLNFFVLLGLGSLILSRIVVNPINRLVAAVERISDGHYGQRLRVEGSAELAHLARSFNQMLSTLQSKERQVAEQVAVLERVNSDLRQAREQALHSEKMASIGLLAAGMAHEVGTPLATIMGYAELMSGDECEDEAVRDYSRRISQECGRIDRIVRGLLDYSRPRTSAVEPVDVSEVVRASLELLDQQGAFKRITVSTYFQEGLPSALADAHQLQQVLINLMLNSRDAMPQGGRLNVRVTAGEPIQGRSYTGTVKVDVLDNGVGIPPEHIAALFEPFFTTKPPGKGTGLGLAIATRIIEGFGGRITVQSTVGRGSCFTIWLPAFSQGVC